MGNRKDIIQVRFSLRDPAQAKLMNEVDKIVSTYGLNKSQLVRNALRFYIKKNYLYKNKITGELPVDD